MRWVRNVIFIVVTLAILAVILVPLTLAVSHVVPGAPAVVTGPAPDIPGQPASTFAP
ncbi:hypothetical protein [Subtercola endophyticus]|uniref:hypothetical protein n=1 Tax=Subtercola endophyticus TaxID=2895559 RepID=UPI001E455B07|nr:hypothetical protein [Subtercola endophyticus]UFS58215.1 hypothetical protein LQ955_14505 [Subtercola endophyticus]